jgi:hypothetical protein
MLCVCVYVCYALSDLVDTINDLYHLPAVKGTCEESTRFHNDHHDTPMVVKSAEQSHDEEVVNDNSVLQPIIVGCAAVLVADEN